MDRTFRVLDPESATGKRGFLDGISSVSGDGSASTKSTRRRVVDDALSGLYGGRSISFRSEGFRDESMHHVENFLADGFDGGVRPGSVHSGEPVLDSKRG